MHGSQHCSGTASRLLSPFLTQALGDAMQILSTAPTGLITGGMSPTTLKTNCFQGKLPDVFAPASLPGIYSICVLYGPDNATLHDLSVTREALYPEKTWGNNSLLCNLRKAPASSFCPKAGFPAVLSPCQLLDELILRGLLQWCKLRAFPSQPPSKAVDLSCTWETSKEDADPIKPKGSYGTLAPGVKVATIWVSAGEHEHTSKMSSGSFDKLCAIFTWRAAHKIKNLFTESLKSYTWSICISGLMVAQIHPQSTTHPCT